MLDYNLGQIIISKAGRDKNKFLIVIDISDEYVYVVDGKSRKIESPKQKKKKHIQYTSYISKTIVEKLNEKIKISNSDIRKAIDEYTALL